MPDPGPVPFTLTDSGTFLEAGLRLGRSGLTVAAPVDDAGPGPGPGPAAPAGLPVPSLGGARGCAPMDTRESPRHPPAPAPAPAAAARHPRKVSSGLALQLEELEVVGKVGQGGNGAVHLVAYRGDQFFPRGQTLALKTVPMDLGDAARKNINQELRAVFRADSAAILQYYQAFYDRGSVKILMEYMNRGSLSSVAQKKGPVPERLLAPIAAQVFAGLQYLHERKILHRDIKPSNLLVNDGGQVKISDFGVSGQLENTISKCFSWVGTVCYMAPERIEGKAYGYAADVWSAGLTVVECALGRFPYPPPGAGPEKAMGFFDLLHYIVQNPTPTLSTDHFSPEFCDFVARCLAKDPEARAPAAQLLEHPFLRKYRGADGFEAGAAKLREYVRDV